MIEIANLKTGDAVLLGPGYPFLILLSLPMGTIRLQATGMYACLVKEQSPQRGWLCGARLAQAEQGQRDLFREYLNELAGNAKRV